MIRRSYLEMAELKDYHSRLEYLKLLDNNVSSPRDISEQFFKSDVWRSIRQDVIDRDGRFDLGIFGLYIDGPVYVHHINPINKEDILNMSERVTDLNNLVCTSLDTHNAIHYKQKDEEFIERKPGDTILW